MVIVVHGKKKINNAVKFQNMIYRDLYYRLPKHSQIYN